MKSFNFRSFSSLAMLLLIIILLTGFNQPSQAQKQVTIYQYRHVPADKVDEFVERETKYWSKFAESAVKKGNMTFWALLEKVGGYDLPNTSNYLFVNTFNDIDNINDVFSSISEVFPDTRMEDMETGSMSTVTSMLMINAVGWEFNSHASGEDYAYINMIYHNSSAPGNLIALENEHWAPFIKEAMESKKTTQVGWGNAQILSPLWPDMQFNTISYDIYPSLSETLMPTTDENIEWPEEGLQKIGELEQGPRGSVIYRIVKSVSANN